MRTKPAALLTIAVALTLAACGPQPSRDVVGPAASHAEIAAALGGFEVLRAETCERAVAADPGHGRETSGTALDTLVRAVAPA